MAVSCKASPRTRGMRACPTFTEDGARKKRCLSGRAPTPRIAPAIHGSCDIRTSCTSPGSPVIGKLIPTTIPSRSMSSAISATAPALPYLLQHPPDGGDRGAPGRSYLSGRTNAPMGYVVSQATAVFPDPRRRAAQSGRANRTEPRWSVRQQSVARGQGLRGAPVAWPSGTASARHSMCIFTCTFAPSAG